MNHMKHHVVPFGAMRYCVLVTYGACAFERAPWQHIISSWYHTVAIPSQLEIIHQNHWTENQLFFLNSERTLCTFLKLAPCRLSAAETKARYHLDLLEASMLILKINPSAQNHLNTVDIFVVHIFQPDFLTGPRDG